MMMRGMLRFRPRYLGGNRPTPMSWDEEVASLTVSTNITGVILSPKVFKILSGENPISRSQYDALRAAYLTYTMSHCCLLILLLFETML